MMPRVKATKTSNIQFILQDFPKEFMKSSNNKVCCNMCSCTVSCNERFLAESHRNTSKHQKSLGSKSELQIPHTSQTFLRSSNINFVEKVTKAFLSADILLFELNDKHIKNLFHDIGHSRPSNSNNNNNFVFIQSSTIENQY